MSGVNMPTQKREGLLDTVMKGLAVARDIYGIRADQAALDAHEQKQQDAEAAKADQARIAKGVYNRGEQNELMVKHGLTTVPEGTPGAISVTDADTGKSVLLGHVSKPEYKEVGGALYQIADGKVSPLIAATKAPKEAKTRELRYTDDQGNEHIEIVEDKPGITRTGVSKTANKEPNSDQYKAGLFAKRLQQAEGVFQDLEKGGFDRTSNMSGLASMLPGALQPENVKRQEQAERNFVNALLRRESGSAISDKEFASAEKQYFPRAGDTPEVLEQKRQNRELAFNGLAAEAGGALGKIETPVAREVKKDQPSGEALAGQGAKTDAKVAQYAKEHGLDYGTARGVLVGRGYKPNE